jgi:hypothetical protein
MQKLGDNRIGFTLINGVLISRTSFQTVSKYLKNKFFFILNYDFRLSITSVSISYYL